MLLSMGPVMASGQVGIQSSFGTSYEHDLREQQVSKRVERKHNMREQQVSKRVERKHNLRENNKCQRESIENIT